MNNFKKKIKSLNIINSISEEKDVALIGISLRTSFADNIFEYWKNLKEGKNCIRELPLNRKIDIINFLNLVKNNTKKEKNIFKKSSYLNEIDKFDYNFFNINKKEAEIMDPNQRLFLEVAWSAIEDAGIPKTIKKDCTGVFVGYSGNEDYKKIIKTDNKFAGTNVAVNNNPALLPSRLAYFLNFKGPVLNINTSCSSSLVALHFACQSIKNKECNQAIVGGLHLNIFPRNNSSNLNTESDDGVTRAFDDKASGTNFGEGVIAVVVKSLFDAIKDRDNIYAIIKGSAINNDGRSIGITAPNPRMQKEVLISAWKNSKINPSTISHVEAHGTATRIGDLVEVESLNNAFREYTHNEKFCFISSVKSNIGHTIEASGLFGLAKAALELKNKQLVPSINYKKPNKDINWTKSSVHVNKSNINWCHEKKDRKIPLRCGVSSFGISGTNCHVILEEIINKKENSFNKKNIFFLSAKTEESLFSLLEKYHLFFKENLKNIHFDDVCFTTQAGRKHYDYRIAIIAKNKKDLAGKIKKLYKNKIYKDKEVFSNIKKTRNNKISFSDKNYKNTYKNKHEKLLYKVLKSFLEKNSIEWEKLYKKIKPKKISLPTYSFEAKKCWPNYFSLIKNDVFYKLKWEKGSNINRFKEKKEENILFFLNDSVDNFIKKDFVFFKLIKEIIKDNSSILVSKGRNFRMNDNFNFEIGGEKDYYTLFKNIKNIKKVIFIVSNYFYSKNKEIINFLRIVKNISFINVSIEIIILTKKSIKVAENEKYLNYENSLIMGLGKAVETENNKIKCRSIDIDEDVNSNILYNEFFSNEDYYQIAFRKNVKYFQTLNKINFKRVNKNKFSIKEEGCYVVAGGIGGIGFNVLEYLFSENKMAKVVVLTKSDFKNDKEKSKKIIDFQKNGLTIKIYLCDISKKKELKDALSKINKKFGIIRGVFNCAGKAEDSLTFNKKENEFKDILKAKVFGTKYLYKYINNKNLDFFVLFSSVASIFSAPGQGFYTAANNFLDSFANKMFTDKVNDNKKIISINWPRWREIGMAKGINSDSPNIFNSIDKYSALFILKHILKNNFNSANIVVGKLNFSHPHVFLNKKDFLPIKVYYDKKKIKLEEYKKFSSEKKSLFIKKEFDKKEKIKEIWQEVLGIDNIDSKQNFFEIGGDSLKLMQIQNSLNSILNLDLSIDVFNNNPTIDKLVDYIKSIDFNKKNKFLLPFDKNKFNRFNVSSAQKRIWFMHSLKKNSTLFNVGHIHSFEGKIKTDLLQKTLKILCDYYYTVNVNFFQNKKGEIFQKINQKRVFKVKEIVLDEKSSEIDVADIAKENINEPYNLKNDFLFRIIIIRYAKNKFKFIFAYHHIIMDWRSEVLFCNKIEYVYFKLKNKESIFLNDLLDYFDYVKYENQKNFNDKFEDQEKYWINNFSNNLPILNLPLNKQTKQKNVFDFNILEDNIDFVLLEKIKKIAKKNKVTLYSLLVSVYSIFLYRIFNQNDIPVGVYVDNRDKKEFEKIVGPIINLSILKVNILSDISFKELIFDVHKKLIDLNKNKNYPFDELIKKLKIKPQKNFFPLIRTVFQLFNEDRDSILFFESCKKNNEVESIDNTFGQFDISVRMHLSANKNSKIIISFNPKIFNRALVEKYFCFFKEIIKEISFDFNKKIKNVDILSFSDKKLIKSINKKNIKDIKNKTIQELFETQVKNTPNSIAVEYDNKKLTYQELNEKANRLANYLIKEKQIQREDIVAIILNRSFDMIIAILGTIKAGGAYLPIDVDTPRKRIDYMISNSKAKLLVTEKKIINNKKIKSNIEIIDIKTKGVEKQKKINPLNVNRASDLLYVIYTSGSTGEPKGVMVEHRNAVNFIYGIDRKIKFKNDSKFLFLTSVSFDIFFLEIIFPIVFGFRVFIIKKEENKNIQKIKKIIDDNKINVLQITPSHIKLFLNNKIDFIKNINQILIGGESWNKELLSKIKNSTKADIYNMYGPAETTIWSTVKKIEEEDEIILAGAPIQNTKIYILNQDQQLQPIGIPGELYISGDGLARGYINDKKKTKEVFLPHPFIKDTRIYKTGDLAKMHTDGNIEILGRIDHQIKIRGYRIEPGEIEASIKKQKNIKDVVVIAKENKKDDNKYLVAYYITEKKKKKETIKQINKEKEELKSNLKKMLPDYMLPSYFVRLDKFPLNQNGKLDRLNLPEPKEKDLDKNKYIPPKTEIEKRLAKIWQEVLNVKKVGLNDDFFSLGGHSLIAMHVVSLIKNKYRIKLDFNDFLLNSTIKLLSVFIKNKNQKLLLQQKIKIKKNNFLSYAQKRMWFLYKLEPNSGYYNINHQRIINGDLDITLFKKALSLIVKKNKILLVNFKIVNNLPVQFINHKGNIDLKFYDIEKIPGNKKEVLDNLIKKNNNKNFTLEKDLLIKFSLFKISKYKFIFLLNVHHIVFDLWSVDIFLKELFIIYDDLINKRNKIFLVNKYDYFDYISLESSIKNKNKIKKYEKYWLKVFDKTELTINFPVDRLRFSAHYFSGGIERITIEKKIVDKIKKFCKDFNMTIFTFLFSSYNIFLYRLIRNKNIVVGIPISDRDSLELENIIGFLVNTLAIKTSIKEEDSFIVFLGKVKDILFEAYQNKNYPFDELVKKINPKRNSNTLNILSTMFVFDPMYKRNFKIGEINLKYRSTYSNVNKFDLKLRAKETEEGDIMLIYEYNKNLFFSETINNYLVNIKSIIKNVVKDKNIKIKDIPLMEKKDSIKVIKKINSTKEVTCSKTIIDVFLEMTKKYKNKIAIQCENKKITYNNLLKKAMRLADVLDGKIDTSVPICILTDRREGLPVAIFSVLLLGGSFYLIDKDTNSEIIKRIISLNKTKSILGIGSNKFKSKKFNYFDINEIVKEKNDNEGVDRVREFLRFSPKKSAAIVYTSGSTGDSKGVILSHESILNNIKQRVKIAKLSHKDTLSFNAYTEFISSPLQLLLPFMIGAKLMMYQKEIIRNPLKLFNNINKDMVTAFEIGAYGMELYVDVIRKKREKKLPLKFLRTIWSSGAKTSTNSLNYFCNAYPQKKVIIGYGCSEYSMILNNVYKGNKKIEKVLEGKPTINTEVYILDKNMKILPPGYEGELCVSGKGMCSQYLDKKSKHKKSFLSHPFIKGEKIYKTGDLAKMDFKGNIEILGRIDNQINLRGFRIEPSNIEYNLRTIKGIKESAVILKKDLLIAFYESDNNKKIDNKKIRNYLIKKIPDYMLPSLFLHINKIPHTKSGKLDKKSLINIENIFQKKYSDFKKVTKTEEKLINIWKKTIEVKKISRNDNFFYLGGHSLKAILIMVKINEIFKIDISLKDIFSFPRLKDLACKIDSIRINKMNIKKQEIKKAKGRIYSTR